MKMIIQEIEYKNIRRIDSLKISLIDSAGRLIKNSFIMMANGTGKTTTLELIKYIFDGTAGQLKAKDIESYKPLHKECDDGFFSITVKFDETTYKYKLVLDYSNRKSTFSCTAPSLTGGGRELSRRFPDSIKDLFTVEFVRRFVFDGEQAKKVLDNTSNEAEEAIKYLYRLDEFDNILFENASILDSIQNAESGRGTDQSLKYTKTQRDKIKRTLDSLKEKEKKLSKYLIILEEKKEELDTKINGIEKKFTELNNQKNEILSNISLNKNQTDNCIARVLALSKKPFLFSVGISADMKGLGENMTSLKLPKSSSKDFFLQLANAKFCICDREIDADAKKAIINNADGYLGSEQQSVLNVIKNKLTTSEFDESLNAAFAELKQLKASALKLNQELDAISNKLEAAGGEEISTARTELNNIIEEIGDAKATIKKLTSKDIHDDELTADNNICKAQKELDILEGKIASKTRTNIALKKKQTLERYINLIKQAATSRLKEVIVAKTNEKLKNVIKDDFIEIEKIENYIVLKNKGGASEGQTLSIAYCYLGTMFEDSELEFPFIIDSPAGKMDYDKRRAVAEIVPRVFNQLISFVTSTEVEEFANRFYANTDSQFLTIVANDETTEMHYGIEFFDKYQKEHLEEQ